MYFPPEQHAYVSKQTLFVLIDVLLVGGLMWVFCTHSGHVWVLCDLTVAAVVISSACGVCVVCAAVSLACKREPWWNETHILLYVYAMVVSGIVWYWRIAAQSLFPLFMLSNDTSTTIRLLYPYQLQPMSAWNSELQAASFSASNVSFREQYDQTASHPLRLHWFDVCKLVWLPVLASLHIHMSSCDDTVIAPPTQQQWKRTVLWETIVGMRWWLETMNSIDSNSTQTVDTVNSILLLLDPFVYSLIWRKCRQPLQFLSHYLPHCLTWLCASVYSFYWHTQYNIHHYEDVYRSVWYDGVWCIAVLWMFCVIHSFQHCGNVTKRTLWWLNVLYCLVGVLWWGMYKHNTFPKCMFFGYLPYCIWVCLCAVFDRGSGSSTVYSSFRVYTDSVLCGSFCSLFVVHLCIWWVLERNIHTRHLTEYKDMQTLMIVCFGLLSLLVNPSMASSTPRNNNNTNNV